MGLIFSREPATCAAALMRPPRRRYFRSSTMKNWRIRPQFSSACRMISSAVQPFSSILAASSTTRPSPNEAPQVFSTRIMRSGYSPRSSSAMSSALQQVPLMPPEMAMYSTSSPSLRASLHGVPDQSRAHQRGLDLGTLPHGLVVVMAHQLRGLAVQQILSGAWR